MTSDPKMIEVTAFPALVLRLTDKVTSPLGALWLQALREGGLHSKEHRRRSLSGRRYNLSTRFKPEDMLAELSEEQLTLNRLNCCRIERFSPGQFLTHAGWMTHLPRV